MLKYAGCLATITQKAYVGVVREPGKHPHLRTRADGEWNNKLLAQRECGSSCNIVS